MEAKFRRNGSGPKWFQRAVGRNKDRILETIRKNAVIV
jgi:hypothetical protein